MENKYLKYKFKYSLAKQKLKIVGGGYEILSKNKCDEMLDNAFIQKINELKKKNPAVDTLIKNIYKDFEKFLRWIKDSEFESTLSSIKTNLLKLLNIPDLKTDTAKDTALKKEINWFDFGTNIDQTQIAILCFYREMIVYLIIKKALSVKEVVNRTVEKVEEQLKRPDNYFHTIIVGSTELLSDIDINIFADTNSSFWLTIIEDIMYGISWFDHDKWRVDFYADLSSYVNSTGKIENIPPIPSSLIDDNKELLLKYALISCLKHDNSALFVLDIKNLFLQLTTGINLNINLKKFDDIFEVSLDKTNKLKKEAEIIKTYRASYYNELKQFDDLVNIYKSSPQNILVLKDIILKISEANLYRGENYMIHSTILHIVKCSQSKPKKKTSKDEQKPVENTELITFCSQLSKFDYYFSIIEQFGYMMHNLKKFKESDKEGDYKLIECNLSANKYFSRILNALVEIKSLDKDLPNLNITKEVLSDSETISDIKTNRGNKGITTKNCDKELDLHSRLMSKILKMSV